MKYFVGNDNSNYFFYATLLLDRENCALAFHKILHVSTHSFCCEPYFSTVPRQNKSHDKYQNRVTTTFACPCDISIDLNTDFFLLCFWLLTKERVCKFLFGAYQKYVLIFILIMQKKYKVSMINSISSVHRLKKQKDWGTLLNFWRNGGCKKAMSGFFRSCWQRCLYVCSDMTFTVSLPHWMKKYVWIKKKFPSLTCIYIKGIKRNETKLNSDIC